MRSFSYYNFKWIMSQENWKEKKIGTRETLDHSKKGLCSKYLKCLCGSFYSLCSECFSSTVSWQHCSFIHRLGIFAICLRKMAKSNFFGWWHENAKRERLPQGISLWIFCPTCTYNHKITSYHTMKAAFFCKSTKAEWGLRNFPIALARKIKSCKEGMISLRARPAQRI